MERSYRIIPGRKGDERGSVGDEATQWERKARWFPTRDHAEGSQAWRESSQETERSLTVEHFGGLQSEHTTGRDMVSGPHHHRRRGNDGHPQPVHHHR
jgi:hypothetical protein